MQKMEMVKGEDVERSKMDKETYVDHIVACVDVYLDGTKRQYLQRRSSSTNPYSLQTIEQEVYELERRAAIRRALQTKPGVVNAEVKYGQADGLKDGLLDHAVRLNRAKMGHQVNGLQPDPLDPATACDRSYTGGSEAALASGRNYDATPHGASFDPQRNMQAAGRTLMAQAVATGMVGIEAMVQEQELDLT